MYELFKVQSRVLKRSLSTQLIYISLKYKNNYTAIEVDLNTAIPYHKVQRIKKCF